MTSQIDQLSERDWISQPRPGYAAEWADHFLATVPADAIGLALIQNAIRQTKLALGPERGRRAVAGLLKALQLSPLNVTREDLDRRILEGDESLLTDSDVEFDWLDIASDLSTLFGYGLYGDGPGRTPEECRPLIAAAIGRYQELVADASASMALGDNLRWIADLLAPAEARWALDHDQPVPPAGLAALAGVKPKTMANLLAARELATDARGHVLPDEARRYLAGRESFIPSSWQEETPSPGTSAAPAEPARGEQVFVPVDAEGRPFLPDLARRGRDGVARYAVGQKDAPDFVEDYWEALHRLSLMETPRWRRPPASGKGGWSLVSAQDGWRRFPRVELERMVEATRSDAVA